MVLADAVVNVKHPRQRRSIPSAAGATSDLDLQAMTPVAAEVRHDRHGFLCGRKIVRLAIHTAKTSYVGFRAPLAPVLAASASAAAPAPLLAQSGKAVLQRPSSIDGVFTFDLKRKVNE